VGTWLWQQAQDLTGITAAKACIDSPSWGECANAAFQVGTDVFAVGKAAKLLGPLGKAAGSGLSRIAGRVAASCGASFTAHTRVLLASGVAVPIASLKPGDKVLATNTHTGKTKCLAARAGGWPSR